MSCHVTHDQTSSGFRPQCVERLRSRSANAAAPRRSPSRPGCDDERQDCEEAHKNECELPDGFALLFRAQFGQGRVWLVTWFCRHDAILDRLTRTHASRRPDGGIGRRIGPRFSQVVRMSFSRVAGGSRAWFARGQGRQSRETGRCAGCAPTTGSISRSDLRRSASVPSENRSRLSLASPSGWGRTNCACCGAL